MLGAANTSNKNSGSYLGLFMSHYSKYPHGGIHLIYTVILSGMCPHHLHYTQETEVQEKFYNLAEVTEAEASTDAPYLKQVCTCKCAHTCVHM